MGVFANPAVGRPRSKTGANCSGQKRVSGCLAAHQPSRGVRFLGREAPGFRRIREPKNLGVEPYRDWGSAKSVKSTASQHFVKILRQFTYLYEKTPDLERQ